MTKLERDVWVAAFAHRQGGHFYDRVSRAYQAVKTLRDAAEHKAWASNAPEVLMLREVLASSAEGENG